MIEVKVICDSCKKQIKDPMEDPFFHVTIREKCFKPDGSIYTIGQYDMTLCDECEAMLHEEVSEAETAVKKEAEAAVEEVAPVQLTEGGRKKKADPVLVKVLLKKGWSQMKIAKEMGVTPSAISQIAKKYKESEG